MTPNAKQSLRTLALLGGIAGAWLLFDWTRDALWRFAVIEEAMRDVVFQDGVKACNEAAEDNTKTFDWKKAKSREIIGFWGMKSTVTARPIPFFRLRADDVFCDYSALSKKADLSSALPQWP